MLLSVQSFILLGTSPLEKILIGLFLPCSEYALFDGQLNCRRPAFGKTGVFESLVLTTPGLKARPAL